MRIYCLVLLAHAITIFSSATINNENYVGNRMTKSSKHCKLLNIGSTEVCADCSYMGLTQIPEHFPNNITCLNMVGNILTSLTGATWKKYGSLRNLSLARNQLRELKDGDFVGLSNLTMLDLSLNKIHYHAISEHTFKPLESLKYIDLKQNITQLTRSEMYPNSLQYLAKLETLMIDGLYNKTLPKLPGLTKVYLSGQYGRCRIPELTTSIFLHNPHIQSLYLSNCSVVTIQPDMFKTLPDIKDLDLSWNTKLGFSNITKGLKANNTLKRLKRLNINSVHDYYKFDMCSSLGKEDIAYLNDKDLEVYSVAGNNLVRVEDDAISYFPKTLKYVSIQDNMLMYGKYVDEIVMRGTFKNLIYYDTSRMFMSHTPTGFIHNNTNRISMLHTGHLQKADTDVSFEMFTRYQVKDFFTLLDDRLRKFKITPYGNKSRIFAERANKIEYLDLSENMPGIVQVSLKLFEHSPFIKFLNISNSFLGYQLLDEISLLNKYTSLRVLDLSRNSIIRLLPGTFEKQVHLEQLYLSFNKITNLSFLLNTSRNLDYMDLSYNHIESISSEVRLFLNNLANFSINLANNNLRCACDNLDFLNWVKSSNAYFQNIQETKCKFDNGSTVTLDKVDYEQLHLKCSPPTYSILILVVSLCILAFIIIVSCGLVYSFKWNLRYLYYMTKFKLVGGYQPIDDREYDKEVFVSYANDDRGFVRQHVVQELETDGNISLLVHDRDFRAGEFVADNIMRAITSTRRTLVILTAAYIQSKWCMYELNMARMEAADTGRNVLCVILKEDIPVKYLPIELMDVIKKKTYMEFPTDPQHLDGFWERLRAILKRDM